MVELRYVDAGSGIAAVSNGSPVGDRFVAELAASSEAARRSWVEILEARGIGLAHPDDGWVDRERDTVLLVYPSLSRTAPAPGVLLALGWPDRWRVVRITREVPMPIGASRWAFAEVPRG